MVRLMAVHSLPTKQMHGRIDGNAGYLGLIGQTFFKGLYSTRVSEVRRDLKFKGKAPASAPTAFTVKRCILSAQSGNDL